MKVTPLIKNPAADIVANTRSGPGVVLASTAGGTKSTVDLSATARHLSSLQNNDNDINVEKVNAIRDAIAAGKLRVDPSRIADSLLTSVRELLK